MWVLYIVGGGPLNRDIDRLQREANRRIEDARRAHEQELGRAKRLQAAAEMYLLRAREFMGETRQGT